MTKTLVALSAMPDSTTLLTVGTSSFGCLCWEVGEGDLLGGGTDDEGGRPSLFLLQ